MAWFWANQIFDFRTCFDLSEINFEDLTIADSVKKSLPQINELISKAIDLVSLNNFELQVHYIFLFSVSISIFQYRHRLDPKSINDAASEASSPTVTSSSWSTDRRCSRSVTAPSDESVG